MVHFIEINKLKPSKHRIEELDYLNWLKANRKNINAGSLYEPRSGQGFDVIQRATQSYKSVGLKMDVFYG